MKVFKCFLFLQIALFAFASCSLYDDLGKDSDRESGTGEPVLKMKTDIEGVASRSANLVNAFANGDALGLFVTTGNQVSAYNVVADYINVKSSLSVKKWIQEEEVYLSNNNAVIFAYYPYNAGVTSGSQIPVDATSQTDYMYGTHVSGTADINNSNSTVNLNMRHAGSLVQFLVKKENYTGAGKLTKVEMVNQTGKTTLFSEGTINCTTGVITGTSGKNGSIFTQNAQGIITIPSVFPTEDDSMCIKLLTIPTSQTKVEGEIEFRFTVDGKEYVWNQLPIGTSWKGGHKNTYTVTIKGTELVVGTVSIEPWVSDGTGSVEIR